MYWSLFVGQQHFGRKSWDKVNKQTNKQQLTLARILTLNYYINNKNNNNNAIIVVTAVLLVVVVVVVVLVGSYFSW